MKVDKFNNTDDIREDSKVMRETADLFEKLADTFESENLSEDEKEKIFEDLLGKIMVQGLKSQIIF